MKQKTQQNNIELKWDRNDWAKIANDKFLPLIDNTDRYLILYGSRGSSKSYFVAEKIIYRMLTEDYFRCVLIRNVQQNIKDSSFQMILDVIDSLGLGELFTHTISPLAIKCMNGNKIMARGLDNPTGIKSISEVTCVWYEEDIPSEEAFLTVSTSIRTTKAKYIQEIFSINPETEGDYKDNWFYKRFFEKNEPELSFSNKTAVMGRKGKPVELSYTVHHSTYKDNRFLSDQYIALLEDLKNTNPYYFTVYAEGRWGHKENKAGFYKNFNRGVLVYSNITYNPTLPIHVSFDFNVQPYMTSIISQVSGTTIWVVDEVLTTTPNNTTKGVCRELKRRFINHDSGCFIYGDRSGSNKDTRSESGTNDYMIIQGELADWEPKIRVPSVNPKLVMRGDFINNIFGGGKDIKVYVSDKCTTLINDFMFVKEAPDGTKVKEKVSKDGVSFEKWGHTSDSFDYFICEAFKQEFNKNKRGGIKFSYTTGDKPFNRKHRF
jgi:phage terminase large subunit